MAVNDAPTLSQTRAKVHETEPFLELPAAKTIVADVAMGLAVLIGGLSIVGLVLTHAGPLESIRNWDASLNASLADSRSDWAASAATKISELGGTTQIVLLIAIVSVVLAAAREWRAMLFLPIAMLIEIVTFLSVNQIVGRSRPDVERLGPLPATFSFPSGHVAAMFVCWIGAAILLRIYGLTVVAGIVATLGVLAATAMGWSRIYVGMHHPLDVFLGLLMGIAALVLTMRVLSVRLSRCSGQRLGSRCAPPFGDRVALPFPRCASHDAAPPMCAFHSTLCSPSPRASAPPA